MIGAGGLGSPAALYLAAAGVGRITLVDFDRVDETNLQRQILYATTDVGRLKLDAAAERLRALNPRVTIETVVEPFDVGNARALVGPSDVVLDGTDNFPTRYLVNDACVMAGTPNVFGSILRFEGQVSVFAAPGGPCYRCLHPEPPPAGLIPDCAEGGVLGVLPGVIGAIQATEAIKLLAGIGEPLVGRFLVYDALRMRVRELTLTRDRDCPVCGDVPTIRSLVAYDRVCAAGDESMEITAEQLQAWRDDRRPHVLIDVREPDEHAHESIDGATLIPLATLESTTSHLPRDRPVVVHCRTGGRSRRGAERLRRLGFDARSLAGGLKAWQKR
jgi:adenylyltransferase/sulfurtransferase